MLYTANINGKEVMAATSYEQHCTGFFRPRLILVGRYLSFEQWPALESASAAEKYAGKFLESLGFTRIED